MTAEQRFDAFTALGTVLRQYLEGTGKEFKTLDRALEEAEANNPWFTRMNLRYALGEIARLLEPEHLHKWLSAYPSHCLDPPRTIPVGVVMAGNIPLVGFHDFLSVLISGHRFIGKPSSRDKVLPETICGILTRINPGFEHMVELREENLSGCEAFIATGSDNSQRYFDYYFGDRPHIFRKNRNGVAFVTGGETAEQLMGLADDVFLYFGLGCRSVSKLYIPEGYDFTEMMNAFERYASVIDHHKYANNYNYQKAILEMGSIPYIDNGFIILRDHDLIGSPIATLHYQHYAGRQEAERILRGQEDEIQCAVRASAEEGKFVAPGTTQKPELWEYADNVDTLIFLCNLGKN